MAGQKDSWTDLRKLTHPYSSKNNISADNQTITNNCFYINVKVSILL